MEPDYSGAYPLWPYGYVVQLQGGRYWGFVDWHTAGRGWHCLDQIWHSRACETAEAAREECLAWIASQPPATGHGAGSFYASGGAFWGPLPLPTCRQRTVSRA